MEYEVSKKWKRLQASLSDTLPATFSKRSWRNLFIAAAHHLIRFARD